MFNTDIISPFGYLFDDEERWATLENTLSAGRFEREETLEDARNSCRHLALTNEFAINGHENRVSFVVGSGHKYRVVPCRGRTAPDDLIRKAQDWIDDFIDENCWYDRQQEIFHRKDRDGEVFLRIFRLTDGRTFLRFIEPEDVKNPSDAQESSKMGVVVSPNDAEFVLGYWVENKFISAENVQHRKSNVDRTVVRGIPLFFPVRKNLRRAEKLLRNMSVVAEIQSAIAIIRKHSGSTRSGIENFVANSTDYSTSSSKRFRHYSPGTIIDASSGIDYQFPVAAVDASRYILVLQAELRAIASRLVMPEFMLTSDASNANYSSTMVAEGPAVRMFERLQRQMMHEDSRLFKRVLMNGVVSGALPAETLDFVTIHISSPKITVRNRLEEIQADKLLVELGAMSVEDLAARHGTGQNYS
ncbi:MAG: phage portal protein [Planctomycetia bacterium]|nr:phage portal protein [Planctomycetia bacterium]